MSLSYQTWWFPSQVRLQLAYSSTKPTITAKPAKPANSAKPQCLRHSPWKIEREPEIQKPQTTCLKHSNVSCSPDQSILGYPLIDRTWLSFPNVADGMILEPWPLIWPLRGLAGQWMLLPYDHVIGNLTPYPYPHIFYIDVSIYPYIYILYIYIYIPI